MELNNNCNIDLKQNGLRTTKSRMAIIDILENSKQPLGAEQIYLELKNGNINVNLSTVYRTLDTLEGKGLVKKISFMDDERMLYEYNRMEHSHYLVCVGCKKIQTIKGCPLNNYEKTLESEMDYTILGHKLYLYGYCSKCRENK